MAHSYGGIVITEAGIDPKVKGLVYIAARAPDADEDYAAVAKKFPAPPASTGFVWASDGFGRLTEAAFLRDFAGDLDPIEASVYYAEPRNIVALRRIQPTSKTIAAWRSSAVSTQDRTIDTDLERLMAKRMNATTIGFEASHVSLLSRPKEVAAPIIEAAKSAGR